MASETMVIKKLIWSWIKILSEIAPHLSDRSERSFLYNMELLDDYNQFIALAEQLEMRLSVYPSKAWDRFHWDLDFKFFLNQLLRRSYYCLSHLISLYG